MKGEVKVITQDYVLITYDIPAADSKLRKEVLKTMAAIGAVAYTQSCYLVPFSETSFNLANEISSKGHAVVWVSKQHDEKKALEIQFKYEEHLHIRCATIEQRLYTIKEHIEEGRLNRANRMAEKTHVLIDQLKKISLSFNPPWFLPRIAELENLMGQLYKKG